MSDLTPDHVGVHDQGTLVYVLVSEREKFERIALEPAQHRNGRLLTKSLDAGGVYIVFQYWRAEPLGAIG